MAKSLQIQEADGAPVRNRPKARRIIGIALIVLVVAFALISTVSMHQRAEAADEAAKPLLQRALQNNLIVCAGFLIVGIGIAFDTLTGARNVVVRVIGYIIWAAGIMVATEAILLCGTVLLGNSDRNIPRDTRYVMVVGTALEENSAIPGELSTRLETAGMVFRIAGNQAESFRRNCFFAGEIVQKSFIEGSSARMSGDCGWEFDGRRYGENARCGEIGAFVAKPGAKSCDFEPRLQK